MDSRSLLDLSVHLRSSSKASRRRPHRVLEASLPNREKLSHILKACQVQPSCDRLKTLRRLSIRTPTTSRRRSWKKENTFMRSFQQFVPKPLAKGFVCEVPHRPFVQEDVLTCSLLIANLRGTNDLSLLRKFGVFAILTIGSCEPAKYPSVKGGYLKLDFNNSAAFFNAIDTAARFVDTHIIHGNVLVQCEDGQNKACAVVVAYYMLKFQQAYQVSLALVKEANPPCHIDNVLDRWLSMYERFLNLY